MAPWTADYRDSTPEPLETVFRLYQPVVQDGRWTHGLCEMWWVAAAARCLVHRPGWCGRQGGRWLRAKVPACLLTHRCRTAALRPTELPDCHSDQSSCNYDATLCRFWKLKPVKHSVHIPWCAWPAAVAALLPSWC